MKEYKVSYTGSFTVTYTVKAESEEEAEEMANDFSQSGITQYCGNGGCEQLIGVDFYDDGSPTIEAHHGLEHEDTYEDE
jgi:2-iminoacetate synthase ThiH